jgi:hypothetical protein
MEGLAITLNSIASGNIHPASFIAVDGSNNGQLKQAVITSVPIAVTPNFTQYVPGTPGVSNTYYAVAGLPVFGFTCGMICELTCGTGWTAGQFLAPDANGYGRPWVTGDFAGAIALYTANAGDIARVMVLSPSYTAHS